MKRILIGLLVATVTLLARGYEAGVERIDITPERAIWLSGYGSRTHPSTGVRTRLWAKALAIRDDRNQGVVIVTTDLIGLPRAITDVVSARLSIDHSVARTSILFNSSHTHTGPIVRTNLITMFDLNAEDRAYVEAYGRELTDKLTEVAAAALGKLTPVTLSYGVGEAGFAMNRRQATPKGYTIGTNPAGPMDHSLPVLRVASLATGRTIALLAGYACHNTTLTGDFYELSGDYAGYAQIELEKTNPGATAMFLMLCGADQNPEPRGTVELAMQHGRTFSDTVNGVIKRRMEPVEGPIRVAFEQTRLAFAIHTRDQFERELESTNKAQVRRARAMLKRYDEGEPVRETPYPVQAIAFGKSLTIVALGGEVVVDYDLRVKKEFAGRNLIVAGYSNDVMCYIPSLRVLKEGGYEANDSMIYYGQPGPFAEDVEERIFDSIHRVMARVGK
jgi:neutral ceramidase